MKLSSSSLRVTLGAVAFAAMAAPTFSSVAHATQGGQPRANGGERDEQAPRSGRHRFADGFFTGRFRRQGMYSSLTLGVTNCSDGRNDSKCDLGSAAETKPSFGFTKEFGYRIPWALFGVSYTLGFLRPDWGILQTDVGYQHSLLAVIRPTLPIWRLDLGFSISPGWSRQVWRGPEWSDRMYTQGFALGLGVVAAFHITRGWAAGIRWDIINNYHGKMCASSSSSDKVCREIPDDTPAAKNMGLTGLFLSHRW